MEQCKAKYYVLVINNKGGIPKILYTKEHNNFDNAIIDWLYRIGFEWHKWYNICLEETEEECKKECFNGVFPAIEYGKTLYCLDITYEDIKEVKEKIKKALNISKFRTIKLVNIGYLLDEEDIVNGLFSTILLIKAL